MDYHLTIVLSISLKNMDYMNAVTKFNSLSSFFQINTDCAPENYSHLSKYIDDIYSHYNLLIKYLNVKDQGFNDENLETEIGLFVYGLNAEICRLGEDL